jgi:hypothetical protein
VTQLAQDTFNRANVASPSWGTGTDGKTWTHAAGSATTYDVTSNHGRIANTPGLWDQFLYGSGTATAVNAIIRCQPDATTENFGVIIRSNSGSSTGYFCIYDGGNGQLTIYRNTSGITSLGTFNFTISASTSYWVRGVGQGSTISAKIWQDGNAEPGSPQVSVTDTTYTSGQYGVLGKASNNPLFDQFTVTDNQAAATNTPNYLGGGNYGQSAFMIWLPQKWSLTR